MPTQPTPIDPEQTAEVIQEQPQIPTRERQLMLEQVATWQAPLPPPAALEHYKLVDPSYPERIMATLERQVSMTEKEMQHRHEMERKQQDHIHSEERLMNRGFRWATVRAQGGVLAIAIAGFVLAGYLAFIEAHPVLIGGSGLTGMLTPAVYAMWGSRQSKKSD